MPKLSIAAKLYAIFALLATITVALSAVAVSTARYHAALTAEFESVNTGSRNVERVKSLIYAAMIETHSIEMSQDQSDATKHADALFKINDQIAAVIADWHGGVYESDAAYFGQFAVRIFPFQEFVAELAKLAKERGPQAAREWTEKNYPADVSKTLSQEFEKLNRHYSDGAARIYTRINIGISRAAILLTVLAGLAVLLATAGAFAISRNVAKPLAAITRVTEQVAGGDGTVAIPFSQRGDEIGALARSIGVFQEAMLRNEELNRTVVDDADTRARRQEQMSNEIARFSADVEATLSELGRISDYMLAASSQLANAAADASAKTTRAEAASTEASANVRDIASAADELSASVNEIDRQVAQS
ncbi:MAG: HAMP domain-containing protein, partial [Rhizobiales bacterium]|nr:HAMP domain-containing protein [Hyphomicrobiales bacterium]